MSTTELKINVYEAAIERIEYVFNQFKNVYVAFSGGKDSGILLNLTLEVAGRLNRLSSLGVFHLDYEAQYTETTNYVDRVYSSLPDDVKRLRCCVPVKCPTCTSAFDMYWRPWESIKRDIWVREMPEDCLSAKDFNFIEENLSDYDFQIKFSQWYHDQMNAENTAVLIGIRAEESLDRWRTIVSDRNINKYDGKSWTTKIGQGIYNAYPIFDWKVEDIWTANAKFGYDYNKLYDLFHYAGVPLHAMRVASPFHNAAKASLHLYRTIDPLVWGKMVSRVNGVNFTAIYGGTTAMGWRNIQKPSHFTWKQYAEFLLDTLPTETANNFRVKLATSIKFWREKGGVLPDEAIEELKSAGVDITVKETTNYKTEKKPVSMEYIDEIDSKDFQLIPTWKRLCVTILKNDHVGKYMGFSLTKTEMNKRKLAVERYKNI